MIYPIVKFGNPVLEKTAETVTVFDDELKKLVDDMFESMYAARGVGLAAPQIGISKRHCSHRHDLQGRSHRQAGIDQSRKSFTPKGAAAERRLPQYSGVS